jgi:hypothetical protein
MLAEISSKAFLFGNADLPQNGSAKTEVPFLPGLPAIQE